MTSKLENLPKSVFLKKDFRNLLFCKAYEQVGESLGAIGRAMKYPARCGLNGTARDMWLGKRGIPSHRLEALVEVSGLSLKSIASEVVPKEQNIEVDNWRVVYEDYKAQLQSQRHKRTR